MRILFCNRLNIQKQSIICRKESIYNDIIFVSHLMNNSRTEPHFIKIENLENKIPYLKNIKKNKIYDGEKKEKFVGILGIV